jgi:O-antigen/teichoic acid export membrane protein
MNNLGVMPGEKLRDKELCMSTEGSNKNSIASTASEATIVRELTRGSLLARNTVWNLLGQTIPIAVGLIAIPRLIHAIGTDRFGVLTIAWMAVGYFSFFDLGLGRAMTNLVAQKLASGGDEDLHRIIWTANLLMCAFGTVGGLLLAGLSPLLVTHVLRTPMALTEETRKALYLLGFSLPFVISTAGFRGVLEARQKFGIINLVRLPMGAATFAAPLIVLPWSQELPAVVGILVVARILFWAVHALLALRGLPLLPRRRDFDRRLLPMLFTFGAWMTVSNIVSPLMAYLDRFLVAALLSLTAVAYYSTPFEVVTKLLILPTALVGVLFPAFSSALVTDPQRAENLFRRAVKYVVFALLPLTLIVVIFAQNGLDIWLGPAFASHSSRVLQWLAIGVFANGLATLPFAFVQGAGRADLTGKIHLIELPFYLLAVWALTKYLGIEGTAIAWTMRVIVDCALLFGAVQRLLHRMPPARTILTGVGTITAAFVVSMLKMTLALKLAVAVLELVFTVVLAWVLLTKQERPPRISAMRQE